jgi:hypothetical protein
MARQVFTWEREGTELHVVRSERLRISRADAALLGPEGMRISEHASVTADKRRCRKLEAGFKSSYMGYATGKETLWLHTVFKGTVHERPLTKEELLDPNVVKESKTCENHRGCGSCCTG